MAGLLIIRAATQKQYRYHDLVVHCDNMGIVNHGNASDKTCSEQQVQSDLIILIKKLIRGLPCKLEYEHVFVHLDDILRWDQMTVINKLNVLCGSMAKRALIAAIVNREYIDSNFPFEDIVLSCSGKKAIALPIKSIYHWWGFKIAREFFHIKGIINEAHFDLIHWDGMGSAMKTFPTMFRRWIAKHVCGFCGCNAHLSHYVEGLENVCQACNARGETTAHITICPDNEQSKLYKVSVDALVSWMDSYETDPVLMCLIERYLRARGSSTMSDIAPEGLDVKYEIFIKWHKRLGWQNFIEGRFLSFLVQLQREYLCDRETWRTAESWDRGLIEQLLRITHRQWLLRNAILHYCLPDGRTIVERERIVERVMDLMWTDPTLLLSEDRALLEEDFVKLGNADASDQEYWVAEVESALKAAQYEFDRSRSTPNCSDRPYANPT